MNFHGTNPECGELSWGLLMFPTRYLSPCDSLCLVKLILDCTLVPLIIFFFKSLPLIAVDFRCPQASLGRLVLFRVHKR